MIQNVARLQQKLQRQKLRDGWGGTVSVIVGYTQKYAIYVHERLDLHHPIGQAKFLEQPARQNQDQIAKIIRDAITQGYTPRQALTLAGVFLLGESQLLCPVDTGALRNSGFVRVEKALSMTTEPPRR